MVARLQPAKAAVREACPTHLVLFEQEDGGIYWLRDRDLRRVQSLLGITCENGAVGFDELTASLYIRQLVASGISVGIARGNVVRTISYQQPAKAPKLRSRTIWLTPALLFGQKELDRLSRSLTSKRSELRSLVENLHSQADVGTIYVYQVAGDVYEVDWELTKVEKTTVEALALVAHQAGKFLRCQLVASKCKRKKAAAAPRPRIAVSEPVTYGQLRFPI